MWGYKECGSAGRAPPKTDLSPQGAFLNTTAEQNGANCRSRGGEGLAGLCMVEVLLARVFIERCLGRVGCSDQRQGPWNDVQINCSCHPKADKKPWNQCPKRAGSAQHRPLHKASRVICTARATENALGAQDEPLPELYFGVFLTKQRRSPGGVKVLLSSVLRRLQAKHRAHRSPGSPHAQKASQRRISLSTQLSLRPVGRVRQTLEQPNSKQETTNGLAVETQQTLLTL